MDNHSGPDTAVPRYSARLVAPAPSIVYKATRRIRLICVNRRRFDPTLELFS